MFQHFNFIVFIANFNIKFLEDKNHICWSLCYQVYFDILEGSGITEAELLKKLEAHGIMAMVEGPNKYVFL